MKPQGVLAACVLLSGVCGCYSLHDTVDECKVNLRNRWLARESWGECEEAYEHLCYVDDFEDGYKAGYVTVASGGSPCLPSLPPRKYWKVHYQNPEGQQQQVAWFDGYAHGAVAADMDGVATWSQLITKETLHPEWRCNDDDHHVVLDKDECLRRADELPVEVPPAPEAAELTPYEDDQAVFADPVSDLSWWDEDSE